MPLCGYLRVAPPILLDLHLETGGGSTNSKVDVIAWPSFGNVRPFEQLAKELDVRRLALSTQYEICFLHNQPSVTRSSRPKNGLAFLKSLS